MHNKFKSLTLLWITMTIVFGCQLQITPSKKVVWFIGVDVTASIPAQQFAAFDTMVAYVLSRCKSNDALHLLRLDDDPEDDVLYIELNGGKLGIESQLVKVFTTIISIKQSKNYKGTTNIGGVISYIQRIIDDERLQREKLMTKGYSSPDVVYDAIIFSDGIPSGSQTKFRDWPSSVKICFWGVDSQNEHFLQKMFKGVPDSLISTRPFSSWASIQKYIGLDINRSLNTSILETLLSGKHHNAQIF